MAFNVDGQQLSLGMLGDAFAKDSSRHDEAGDSFSRWGFFLTGMYSNGGYATDQARPGFSFDNASLTAGVGAWLPESTGPSDSDARSHPARVAARRKETAQTRHQ